jgi:hypothetical protein
MQEKLEKAIDVNAPSIVIWLEKEFPIKSSRPRSFYSRATEWEKENYWLKMWIKTL